MTRPYKISLPPYLRQYLRHTRHNLQIFFRQFILEIMIVEILLPQSSIILYKVIIIIIFIVYAQQPRH